jgi:hypothetical protein
MHLESALNRPRGKRLTLLIASATFAVLLGVAFASKDLILTEWYAHSLQSDYDDERRAAITSLAQLGTRRAARVLVAFLGDWGAGALSIDTAVALKDMGKVAMEPVVEGFRLADDIAAEPSQKWPDNLISSHPMYVDAASMLIVLLEIQRGEVKAKLLLENLNWSLPPAEDLDLQDVKYLKWLSAVLAIEGTPCRIFLLAYDGGDSPDLQPQTIVITDAGGRLLTWKEVGGEPRFVSCELETISGALLLIVTCEDARSKTPEKHAYRLTLRGIEEEN